MSQQSEMFVVEIIFLPNFFIKTMFRPCRLHLFQLNLWYIPFKIYRTTWEGGKTGRLLGYYGSAAACSRKWGLLNYETSWRGILLLLQNNFGRKSPQTLQQLTMWYSNVLIEFFQLEITSSQRNIKFLKQLWECAELMDVFVELMTSVQGFIYSSMCFLFQVY